MAQPAQPSSPPLTKLRAPFTALRAIFGDPDDDTADGVSTSWNVDVDGVRVHIADAYDETDKAGPICRKKGDYDWNVSAPDQARLARACKTLSTKVIAAVIGTGARSLTAEDRDRLNALLKSGVAMAEAIKQVRLKLDEDGIRVRYVWPIGGEKSEKKK